MTTKNKDQLIFNDDSRRLTIHFSPEILEGSKRHDDSDYILADLLTWLKSFNLEIERLRKKFSIQPVAYHVNSSVKQLIDLVIETVNYDRYRDFDSDIDKLMHKYQLTENWGLSLRIAVLTNALLIPMSESISVHLPEYEDSKKVKDKKTKTLRELAFSVANSPEMQRQYKAMHLIKYPSIYFTRKTTINELKRWIDRNKRLIRIMQYKLPPKKTFKRDNKTLFWGKVAWIIKQDGVKSWAKIAKLVLKQSERMIEKEGEKENKDLLNPPDEIELRKYYIRFVESLQRIEQPPPL